MCKRAYQTRNIQYKRLESIKSNLFVSVTFWYAFCNLCLVVSSIMGHVLDSHLLFRTEKTQYINIIQEKKHCPSSCQLPVTSRSIFHLNGTEFKSVLISGIRMKWNIKYRVRMWIPLLNFFCTESTPKKNLGTKN